jgi:predicted phosphodiesterase
VAAELIRIFSDIHYADHSSRVRRLAQLRPLLDGVSHLVLNGDTLDTRPGSAPARTAAWRAEVLAFFPQHVPTATLLTGNHDADLTKNHALDLADGTVFVTHGDILHEDIVPWSQDGPPIGRQIAAALAQLPAAERTQLAARFEVWRRVAAGIPQRHQSEPNSLRYILHYARDTIWPPSRIWRVLRVWREEPALVAAFARVHRPKAKIVVVGHTHRPGVWRTTTGTVVVNTGSFTKLLGACAVDLTGDHVTVRRIEGRTGEFQLGATIAAFSLADLAASPRLSP